MGIIDRFRYKHKNSSASEVSKEIDDPILRALLNGKEITREDAIYLTAAALGYKEDFKSADIIIFNTFQNHVLLNTKITINNSRTPQSYFFSHGY